MTFVERGVKAFVCVFCLCFFNVPGAEAGNAQVVNRGWRPPIVFTGEGDEKRALAALKDMSTLQAVMLNNTRFDTRTERFVEDLWASFERFDLKKFHAILPEQADGWRFLAVQGAVEQGRYRVGAQWDASRLKANRPDQFGEMAVRVRAKPGQGPRETYWVDTQFSVGMGDIAWSSIALAAEETLRLLVKDTTADGDRAVWPAGPFYRDRVLAMNDRLQPEDIEILAPLWAAFPAQWELLARLGRFEDVVLQEAAAGDHQKLHLRFVLDPDKMTNHYPALAQHLSSLGSLSQIRLRAMSEQGEVFRLSMDSEALLFQFEAYVKDGQLVALPHDKVDSQPLARLFRQPWRLELLAESRMKILGVVTDLRDLRIALQFTPTASGARAVASMTHVPQVNVSGNALGFIPTRLVSALMPSDIDGLILDFLRVMCEGNEGRGLIAAMEYTQAPAGATLDTAATFEGLNNFFVQFGMGIVNDRILPDPQVSIELRRLMFDTQQAFAQDLDTFAQTVSL